MGVGSRVRRFLPNSAAKLLTSLKHLSHFYLSVSADRTVGRLGGLFLNARRDFTIGRNNYFETVNMPVRTPTGAWRSVQLTVNFRCPVELIDART